MSEAGWAERVQFSDEGDGFAYRPGEIVVAGMSGVDAVNRRHPSSFGDPEPVFHDVDDNSGFTQFFRMVGDVDPIPLVHELNDDGVVAQPNHVLFAHGECCCGPHPAAVWGSPVFASPVFASPVFASPVFASPVFASPVFASPVFASPVFASPVFASPVFASPVFASTYRATGARKSSARPSDPPSVSTAAAIESPHTPRVLVLDTGFAEDGLRPAALGSVQASRYDREGPDEDQDSYLDPAAGHGTFIAGIIDQIAPGCAITVAKVLTTYGDGDEVAIAQRIRDAAGNVDLLNLSFGGYAMPMAHLRVLASAVRHVQAAGAVVVSSAGNDATCRPTYPAALPGVIAVGAVGPNGPAPFTNYGPWVRACAPGVDLVSSFFREFHGAGPAPAGGTDPDDFESWAVWSGTSFAAPAVVGALAREMRTLGVTPAEAVARVIDDPRLMRIADLGTVVNVVGGSPHSLASVS
jgi:hypothetical protein